MTNPIESFIMKGYTFEQGVAFLSLLVTPTMLHFVQRSNNKEYLDRELGKLAKNPIAIARAKKMSPIVPEEKLPEYHGEIILEDGKIDCQTGDFTPNEDIPDETGEKQLGTKVTVTYDKLQHHKNTRYEDMPTKLTQELYRQKEDKFHLLQQVHLKMRNVPRGSEHNKERAELRTQVDTLTEDVEKLWSLIDEEIAKFNKNQEDKKKRQYKKPDFNVSTYRSYISKALQKLPLSPEKLVELQHRVDAMLECGLIISDEQTEKLKTIGIEFRESSI